VREQIEACAGERQADHQFVPIRACKFAASERPEISNNHAARPRCAHESTGNPAALHGRALIVARCSTVPARIITRGCRDMLGVVRQVEFWSSRAIARRHLWSCLRSWLRRQSLQRSIAAADRGLLCFRCVGVGSVVADRVHHLGTDRSLPASVSLARYWTSVQSKDPTRWRNVHTLAGLPGCSVSARGSLARGALPHPPGRASRLRSLVARHLLERLLSIGPRSNRFPVHRVRSLPRVPSQRTFVD
jgi:hypothetical protein